MMYFMGFGVEHLDSGLRMYDSGHGTYDLQSSGFVVLDLGLGFCANGWDAGLLTGAPPCLLHAPTCH